MKLYIAGSSKERARYRQAVRGIDVTYDWERGFQEYEAAKASGDSLLARRIFRAASVRCASGVRRADSFVMLVPETGSCGAWLELGIAHERAFGFEGRMRLYSVGDASRLDIWGDLFYLHFATMDECLAHLRIQRRGVVEAPGKVG